MLIYIVKLNGDLGRIMKDKNGTDFKEFSNRKTALNFAAKLLMHDSYSLTISAKKIKR